MRAIGRLPVNVLNDLGNNEHVKRHEPGLWNGLWSDMFVETTPMRYRQGQCNCWNQLKTRNDEKMGIQYAYQCKIVHDPVDMVDSCGHIV